MCKQNIQDQEGASPRVAIHDISAFIIPLIQHWRAALAVCPPTFASRPPRRERKGTGLIRAFIYSMLRQRAWVMVIQWRTLMIHGRFGARDPLAGLDISGMLWTMMGYLRGRDDGRWVCGLVILSACCLVFSVVVVWQASEHPRDTPVLFQLAFRKGR